MAEFLKSQLDYIYFFYGFSFLLLIPVCLFLRRKSYLNLPWVWLVWFGALHGLNEVLDLLSLSLEPIQALEYVRLGTLIISFICLAEFGRVGCRSDRGLGRWVLAALLIITGMGGVAGMTGLFAVSRYALGLIGGLWAAAALFLAARTEPSAARPLYAGALSLVIYALSTGPIVPSAPFFPAYWLNYNSFLAFTGLPIQLLRGLIAFFISISLCWSALTSLEKDQHFHKWLRHLMMGILAGLPLLLLSGWIFTQRLGDIATQDKWNDYKHDIAMIRLSLMQNIIETERFAEILGNSPLILPALLNKTSQNIELVNSLLDVFGKTTPELVFYLIDLQGITIATSDRTHTDSFLGRSPALSTYLRQAMQGSAGGYWALGVTADGMGYYAGFPVKDKTGKTIGVAFTKRTFSDFKSTVYQNQLGLVIDQHGIIILSNRPDMVLKSLWPLSDSVKKELIASGQFGEGPFAPVLSRKPLDKVEVAFEGKPQMALIEEIPYKSCAIVLIGSLWPIAQARLFGISATFFSGLLLIGFLATIVIMQESKEGFRQLFEKATDGLILHDRGRIIEVNQQICRLLGYTREELLRMSIFDIEVGYSKDYLMDLWGKREEVVTLSGIYRRKDGLTFPTEIKAAEISYRGQTLRLAAARDVSARKQAEEALKESEEHYRSLFNNMLNGYAYCQMYFEQGLPVDFIFLNINEAFGNLTGLRNVIGKKISEAVPGIRESDPDFIEMCGRVVLTARPERVECYVKALKIWFSISVYSPLQNHFVAIFEVITERKVAEEALRNSEAALRQSQEKYRMLAGQLLTAQEVERKRLARELHDDLSQRLAGLAMEADMLGQKMPSEGTGGVELKDMKEKLVQLSIDVHSLSRQLHPSILDDLGLADAIASECERFRRQYSIAIDFRTENITKTIPPDISLSLYRIVQEGLRNISKHARATEVAISLIGKDDSIQLTLMDDGKGFDPGQKGKAGLGLDSMQERIYLVGGTFQVKSQPGQGTLIEVQAPLVNKYYEDHDGSMDEQDIS